MPEYREFLKKYKTVQKDVQEFLSQVEKLTHAYKNQLPIHLIARCPICGEALEEPLDTYSLNGIGWGRGSWFKLWRWLDGFVGELSSEM